MNITDVIRKKRDGHELSDDEIRWFIESYTHGSAVADEQASALLMAIVWRGMTPDELFCWTQAMIDSGETIDLSDVERPTVDKHSTGGVGDKISLIVVPMLAACGAAVPQLSGRGLAHTGGTLDKMEAIPGWQAELTEQQMVRQLQRVGGVIAGASHDLVPADRKLYALRDVTGTVESIPLIASSIMSKKIAEGASALVLDVKVGRGAFMKTFDEAETLAKMMVSIGQSHGVRTTALLTDMDCVLGRAVGNGLEVIEALEVLEGHGPSDVTELSLALAHEMALLAGVSRDPAEALSSGDALAAFIDIVEAQSGNLSVGIPRAPFVEVFHATDSGYVHELDPYAIGTAAWRLGAGRRRKEDLVSPVAGIICLAKPGDAIRRGDPLFALHTDEQSRFATAIDALTDSTTIRSTVPASRQLVLKLEGGSRVHGVSSNPGG
jgi:thymidine phosphorylase